MSNNVSPINPQSPNPPNTPRATGECNKHTSDHAPATAKQPSNPIVGRAEVHL